MMRVLGWLVALLALVMIGVIVWPAEHRTLLPLLGAAAVVLAGIFLPSSLGRAAAIALAVVALTVIAEPELLLSRGGDPRIAWAALLAAAAFRREAIRVPTLVAAGVLAVTLSPPSDISLLSVAPAVLLQVSVCLVAIVMQLLHRPAARWWRVYRAIEPLVCAVAAAIVVIPFGRNGLTLVAMLAWYLPPAIAAAVVGVVAEIPPPRQTVTP
jgi:hypothetical protein